jgi:hypothetical protein
VQGAQCIHFGQAPDVIDRCADYKFWGPVLRPTISIDDDSPVAGKTLENARLDGSDDGLNRLGIIVGRKSYQDIHLADVDELAKEIVGQKRLFRQFNLPPRI